MHRLIIAKKDEATLRQAVEEDLERILEITITCYASIQESFVSIIGEDLYDGVIRKPTGLEWTERKERQIRRLFDKHPEWIWVLEDESGVFGYVSFTLAVEQSLGEIDNNGIDPSHAGKGWATFMYRHVLNYFRENEIHFAFVETELDDAHIPARRAYEAVGFDRPQKIVHYWQNLDQNNQGSIP